MITALLELIAISGFSFSRVLGTIPFNLGDSLSFRVHVRDDNGLRLTLTGYTLTAKFVLADGTTIETLNGGAVDFNAGIFSFSISNTLSATMKTGATDVLFTLTRTSDSSTAQFLLKKAFSGTDVSLDV